MWPVSTSSRQTDNYLHIRKHTKQINSRIIQTIDGLDIRACARKLKLLKGDRLLCRNETEMDVLFDFCIFENYKNGENAVQRFHRTNPAEDLLTSAFLSAACEARFCLAQFEGIGNSPVVEGVDLLRDEDIQIFDVGLYSSYVQPTMMAFHIIDLPEFSMTSGAALPFYEDSLKRLERKIGADKKITFGDMRKIMENYETATDMALKITQSCLETRTSEFIHNLDPETTLRLTKSGRSDSPANDFEDGPLPSRNQPCPCGSGRLYKKCCGKGMRIS